MRCGAGTASTVPATKCRKSTGRTDLPKSIGSSDSARTVSREHRAMEQRTLVLPRLLPIQQERPPQETIPQTRLERDRIKAVVQSYVAELKPVPPMPLDDLRLHAETIVAATRQPGKYRDYVAVLL